MKKMITIVAALTLMTGALVGCGAGGSSADKNAESKKADSSQTVATDGSTSMEKVIGYLSEAYMEEHFEPVIKDKAVQALSLV